MKYIIEMWKRTFDYKGRSGRKEFWIPLAVSAVMGALLILLVRAEDASGKWLDIPILIIAAYIALSAVPFISLTVRRLHDTGRSGWWYCLVFGFGIGGVILLVMCASEISLFRSADNIPSTVYGPPPPEWTDTATTTDFDPDENIGVTVYGPPEMTDVTTSKDFDPGINTLPAVYGPPDMFNTETTGDISVTENLPDPIYGPPSYDGDRPAETSAPITEAAAAITTVTAAASAVSEPEGFPEPIFSAYENIETCVYGPPEWFGITTADTDEEFDPRMNIEQEVYGPPEWFN